jgi:hypothetical protein
VLTPCVGLRHQATDPLKTQKQTILAGPLSRPNMNQKTTAIKHRKVREKDPKKGPKNNLGTPSGSSSFGDVRFPEISHGMQARARFPTPRGGQHEPFFGSQALRKQSSKTQARKVTQSVKKPTKKSSKGP